MKRKENKIVSDRQRDLYFSIFSFITSSPMLGAAIEVGIYSQGLPLGFEV